MTLKLVVEKRHVVTREQNAGVLRLRNSIRERIELLRSG